MACLPLKRAEAKIRPYASRESRLVAKIEVRSTPPMPLISAWIPYDGS